MTYNVTDITELIRRHLVLSEVDDDRADRNLAQLMRTSKRWLRHRAGATDDVRFYCTECRFADEEP